MRVLICGGGTGGHIYPGLALARYLVKKNKENVILFVGTSQGLENEIIPNAGFKLEVIPVRAFNKRSLKEISAASFELLRSLKQAREIIKRFKPDVVVGTGGYAAGPVVLASRLQRVPVLIHEQNVVPGFTNRLLAGRVNRVCISFEETRAYLKKAKVKLTGNPRASEIGFLSREEGLKRLPELDGRRKTVLVFGGSRGALQLNKVMVELINRGDFPADIQFLYITGELYYEDVIKELKKQNSSVVVKPYLTDMPAALAAAELVISRAGATALAEITVCGVPAVLVPSPNVAYNHQYYNALLLEKEGAAVLIEEKDFTVQKLGEELKDFRENSEVWQKMSHKSKKIGMPEAAEMFYQCILEEIIPR